MNCGCTIDVLAHELRVVALTHSNVARRSNTAKAVFAIDSTYKWALRYVVGKGRGVGFVRVRV
jgi:hypothetical protein